MWDATKPSGSRKIRLSDDDLRENNSALEAALSEGHEFTTGGDQTGKHTTPTFKDNGVDPSAPPIANETVFYNLGGEMFWKNNVGNKYTMKQAIPSGTKMLFYQASAPTGWTFDSSVNDRVVMITSTESAGGASGGSWTISGCSVDNHTLTISEIPSHRHTIDFWQRGYAGGTYDNYCSGTGNTDYTNYTGGGEAHNHGFSSDASWRPLYIKTIICEKT